MRAVAPVPQGDVQEKGKAAGDLTILIQGYSAYLTGLKKSPRTVKEYTKDVTRWAAWWKRGPEFFRELEWDDWTNHLGASGVAGRSIRRYQTSVKRFFKYLRRLKLITHDPAHDAETVQMEKKVPVAIELGQVLSMIQRASSVRSKAMVSVLFWGGLRNAELRNLRMADVSADSLLIRGKGSKERIVPLAVQARETLGAWLAVRKSDGDLVFPTNSGGIVSENYVCKLVKRLAASVGVAKRVTPHTLRHSVATWLLNQGCPLAYIQEFLGHGSIDSTRGYTQVAKGALSSELSRHFATVS